MENNEKWEAVKRRNKISILQSVNKFREEANKMKRKMQRFVTVSTAAALSLAMAVPGSAAYQPEQKFQDVSRSASYYEDVMDANYYGLMAGVSGKTFDTESTITRAMWVTMLYKMAGQPAVQSKDTFTDVKTGDWFAQAATWAVEQGITAGYEDGSFGVNQTITRQEMAVMASKFAAQYKDAAVSASANLAGYADAGELDSWASEAMSWALSSGVMQAVDGKLSPKSTVSRAKTAGVAVRLYELGGVDLDTITALEKDWTQAAQLPLTGWFTKNIDVEGDRQVTVYISEEASIRSYFTVIAVPNGVDTQQFLEDEGWIDLMDQKGEALFVLEPGAEGWGSAAEEKAYMDAAIAFLKSGNNEAGINVFSTFGEFYLAGYGEGAAPLEAWAAENPIFVISQAFVDGESAGDDYLASVSSKTYDGKSANGDITDVLDKTLKQVGIAGEIAPKDAPVPTWLAAYTGSDAHWKTANDCEAAAEGDTYYQKLDSDAYQTDYANSRLEAAGADHGISQVKVTGSADVSAAELYAWMAQYTRYDTTFAYSNAIAQRLDYTSARVAAQKQAKAGQVQKTLSDGTQILAQEDVAIDGHGTVQVGVIAFSDNSGDGLWDPREYIIYVPEGFEGKELPVLMIYPGNTQTDSIFLDSTLWWQIAEDEGIVLAFVCETYNASPCSVSHADSDKFYHSLITILEEQIDGSYADLDFTRIYGSGQSAGSNTTQGFAMTNPEFYAAVATTSGAVTPKDPSKNQEGMMVTSTEPAYESIPTMMVTGQMDSGSMADGFEAKDMQSWANYMLQVNGFEVAYEANSASSVVNADSRHPEVYIWSKTVDGVEVPLVQWAQCLLRPHNCYPSDMPMLWDFMEHFSFEKAADGTVTRYYSPSAFEKDDAVALN